MSVIHYDPYELGNVAAVVAGLGGARKPADLAALCADLERFSRENTAACRATHADADGTQHCTADDISHCAPFGRPDLDAAIRVVTGMRYNLVANSGEDCATVTTLDNICGWLKLIVWRLQDERRAAATPRAA